MRLSILKDMLAAEVLWGDEYLNTEIKLACGSDLLSDVLTYIKPESILFTGLTNTQVVRTAEIAEIAAICFVHGKKPQAEALKLARTKKIILLTTKLSMYESCGCVYKAGLPGCDNAK